jgi:hypothetical protein
VAELTAAAPPALSPHAVAGGATPVTDLKDPTVVLAYGVAAKAVSTEGAASRNRRRRHRRRRFSPLPAPPQVKAALPAEAGPAKLKPVSATSQVVAGTNYAFVIAVTYTSTGAAAEWTSTVFVPLPGAGAPSASETACVTGCEPPAASVEVISTGSYTPVKISDAAVKAAFAFATPAMLEAAGAAAGAPIKLKSAQTQLVSGTNVRMQAVVTGADGVEVPVAAVVYTDVSGTSTVSEVSTTAPAPAGAGASPDAAAPSPDAADASPSPSPTAGSPPPPALPVLISALPPRPVISALVPMPAPAPAPVLAPMPAPAPAPASGALCASALAALGAAALALMA